MRQSVIDWIILYDLLARIKVNISRIKWTFYQTVEKKLISQGLKYNVGILLE